RAEPVVRRLRATALSSWMPRTLRPSRARCAKCSRRPAREPNCARMDSRTCKGTRGAGPSTSCSGSANRRGRHVPSVPRQSEERQPPRLEAFAAWCAGGTERLVEGRVRPTGGAGGIRLVSLDREPLVATRVREVAPALGRRVVKHGVLDPLLRHVFG